MTELASDSPRLTLRSKSAPSGAFASRSNPPGGAPPAAEAALVPGAVVNGKYRLTRQLARGGMGAVWSAQNLGLQNDLAIKFLLGGTDDPTTPLRLQNEAHLLACIQHPSLVHVHDVGVSESGIHYLVMELLAGADLFEHLSARGPLPPVEAVRLMLPIVDALRAAHGAGVVHRDIKPDNIFLASIQGRTVPKLLDFGVALTRHTVVDQRLTRAGTIIGSPLYMSPEQACGSQDLDERVDVWGVSAVLYECLSCRPPFSGEPYEALLHAILTTEPAPLNLEAKYRGLETIVLKGLEKNPDARWDSSEALGLALADWLLEQGVEEDLMNQRIRSIWPNAALDEPSQSEAIRARISSSGLARFVPKKFGVSKWFWSPPWCRSMWAPFAAGMLGMVALGLAAGAELESASSQDYEPEAARHVAPAKMGKAASKKLLSVAPLEIRASTARNADVEPVSGADAESEEKSNAGRVQPGVAPVVTASPPRSGSSTPSSSDNTKRKESVARAKPPSYDPVWGF